MPPSTALRALGVVVAVAWAAQLAGIAISTYLSTQVQDVPADAWLWLVLHLFLAALGVTAGVLAVRGSRSWKWLALVSGIGFLAITDFGWYSLASNQGGVISFLARQPRIGFGVLVMPLLAVAISAVALWRVIRDAIAIQRGI